jgi:hypothetical protein
MDVLFFNREAQLAIHGGDVVQMTNTRDALEQLGVSVEVSPSADSDVGDYDIVHMFNIQYPEDGILRLRTARSQGVPIVLSPSTGTCVLFLSATPASPSDSSSNVRRGGGVASQSLDDRASVSILVR